ncbi:MAG: GNAT family N-acetyltransferase [Chloroflexi bacterium]|nr:GNAT family N-acetyltransferase [Chloroflexota bacterium]
MHYIKPLISFGKKRISKKYPKTRLQMKRVFTDSDDISSSAKLPDGFVCIHYSTGLEDKWLEIINSSGEFCYWNIDLLEKEILNTLIYQGGVLVSAGDRYVACAAICERDQFRPNALLMYVIVEKQFRGLGLGKYITLQALSSARLLGYPGVVLRTDDYRIPAVNMYYQLGFLYDPVEGMYNKRKWNALVKKIETQK